jgi:hypothetical protein
MNLLKKRKDPAQTASAPWQAKRAALEAILRLPLIERESVDIARQYARNPHEAHAAAHPDNEVVSDDVFDETTGRHLGTIAFVVSDNAEFITGRDALLAATAKVIQKQYTELKLANGKIISIDYSQDGVFMGVSGAEIYEIVQFDNIGMMQIISDYGKGGPSSDVIAERAYVTVRVFGGQVQFSLLEILRLMGAGQNLPMRKMESLKHSYMKYLNAVGYHGDVRGGLQGLLTISGTTNYIVPTPITPGVNADYLLSLLTSISYAVPNATNGIETPSRLVTPRAVRDIAMSVRRYGVDVTVYEEFMHSNSLIEDGISEWVIDDSLLHARNGRSVCLLVSTDMDKVCLKVPQQFTTLDAQIQNFGLTVHAFGSTAGVVCTAPASIMVIENMLPPR